MSTTDTFRDVLATTIRRRHPDWTEDMVQQYIEQHHDAPEREKQAQAKAMIETSLERYREASANRHKRADALIADLINE